MLHHTQDMQDVKEPIFEKNKDSKERAAILQEIRQYRNENENLKVKIQLVTSHVDKTCQDCELKLHEQIEMRDTIKELNREHSNFQNGLKKLKTEAAMLNEIAQIPEEKRPMHNLIIELEEEIRALTERLDVDELKDCKLFEGLYPVDEETVKTVNDLLTEDNERIRILEEEIEQLEQDNTRMERSLNYEN